MKRSNKLDKASELLIARSYAYTRRVYGEFGRLPLPYHNHLHTLDVVAAASSLGELAMTKGKISPTELAILQIAAAGHDLVHDMAGNGVNEQQSAKKIAKWMIKQTPDVFKKPLVSRVENIIMATVCGVNQRGFWQSAGEDYLGQLMCDADVSAAGLPPEESKVRSDRLYLESLKGEQPGPENRLVFLQNQVVFYSTHNWYTEEAKVLLPYQERNLHMTLAEIETLQA